MSGLALPVRRQTYQTPVFDSRRWDQVVLRDSDVIVCTPPKCGTTWTQMICAMLIHDCVELPAPLNHLSRWVDRHTLPIETLVRDLQAQSGPRVMKTHTPLDGLPYHPDVRYVFCGRDPRDAFLSMMDHMRNLSARAWADAAEHGATLDTPLPEDPNRLFPMWATQGQFPWMYDGAPFQSVLSFTETYWRFRRLPNLLFVHYRDLTEDLDGEMRRVAAFLDRRVDEGRWPEFLRAATFSQMRARAAETAPNADLGEWRSDQAFFASGRIDAWRNRLTAENLNLYERINLGRTPQAMKAWLECGARQVGDPKVI